MSKNKGNVITPLLLGALLIAIAVVVYFFWQNQQLQKMATIEAPIPIDQKTPTPALSNLSGKTANWTNYDLQVVNLKLPSNFVEKEKTIKIPPELYDVLKFIAQTADYNFQEEAMGLASSGTLISGQKFDLYATDFVKATKDYPDANTPQNVEDEMKINTDAQLGDVQVKTSDCNILQISGNKFWVCYSTTSLTNTGTWRARVYHKNYVYDISLQSKNEAKLAAKTQFDQILSSIKFTD